MLWAARAPLTKKCSVKKVVEKKMKRVCVGGGSIIVVCEIIKLR